MHPNLLIVLWASALLVLGLIWLATAAREPND
jgi:hypothetical protein